MSEHTPSEQADSTPNRVQHEIMRIQRLFVPSQGDKEDILSYARHVVGIERERDEALTNSHDRIAELNAEATSNEAKISALTKALADLVRACDIYDERPEGTVNQARYETAKECARAALSSHTEQEGK